MSTSTSRAVPLDSSDLLEETVARFLEEVASQTPAPGGGAVAALVVAMGASLVEMVARFSCRGWDGAEAAVARAQVLRGKIAPLAQADADAYRDLLVARRLPADAAGREAALEAAQKSTVEVPLEVATCASEVAELAAALAERGNPNLRGDAVAAALAAATGARIGAELVELNLEGRAGERLARAREAVTSAAAAAERAVVVSAS
jgi:methenyltetrahydrofolate cyclohydrolase